MIHRRIIHTISEYQSLLARSHNRLQIRPASSRNVRSRPGVGLHIPIAARGHRSQSTGNLLHGPLSISYGLPKMDAHGPFIQARSPKFTCLFGTLVGFADWAVAWRGSLGCLGRAAFPALLGHGIFHGEDGVEVFLGGVGPLEDLRASDRGALDESRIPTRPSGWSGWG